MIGYRVLDTETVPDLTLWKPGPSKYDLFPGPSNLRYEAEALSDWNPAVVTRDIGFLPRDEFPPAVACQLVAMAWVDLSGDDNEWYFYRGLYSRCDFASQAEAEMLRSFIGAQEGSETIVVTWNGRQFDMPVINLRALHHQLPMKFFYQDREYRYRYSELGHLDLMDVFADYGAARFIKLDDLARSIGLPGKEGDVKGGSIRSLYLRAQDQTEDERNVVTARIADYCLSDAVQTALLFVRSRYHRGMIDGRYHNRVIDSFIAAAQNPDSRLGQWHARRLKEKTGVIDWERLKISAPSQDAAASPP